jgi:mono/diheme cytochrome c family protein
MHLTRTRTALTAILCSAAIAGGCGGSSSGGSSTPAGGGSGSADGAQIFADNCAACHGDQGQGGVGPNLQTSTKAGDKQAVVDQVTNGGGGMPPFGDKLSDQEIQAVADYVVNTIHKG